MPNVVAKGSAELEEDYHGTRVDLMCQMMAGQSYPPDGDKEKAVKAIYEVVIGEGVGKGREAETVLPLGRDAAMRIKAIADQWTHTMDVFGDVCNNVYQEA